VRRRLAACSLEAHVNPQVGEKSGPLLRAGASWQITHIATGDDEAEFRGRFAGREVFGGPEVRRRLAACSLEAHVIPQVGEKSGPLLRAGASWQITHIATGNDEAEFRGRFAGAVDRICCDKEC